MQTPVLIVGGGVMGCAAAFFLARDHGIRARVVERDPTWQRASSALSASSIRQQFSSAINIRLSQQSLAFLRIVDVELATADDVPAIGLREPGYLYLAATEAGRAVLADNHAVQAAHGADVALLDPRALRLRFPWLETADLVAGSLGLSGEGWFDGYALLQAFRRKAAALGVVFVADEVDLLHPGEREIRATTRSGKNFIAERVLIAAGAWSAPLAAQLGFELPVSARKRDVFVFEAPGELPDCPLVIDPAGVWFRPEGRAFICGAPPRGDDRDDLSLDDVDFGLFDDVIWPVLANRVPLFEAVRLKRGWAGYYEFNQFDQNGLVGCLPGAPRVFVACGFSGHGMQQAPAVGRGVAELMATGRYDTLDLDVLSPARIAARAPVLERNVI